MKKTYLLLILITVLCLMVAFTAAAEGCNGVNYVIN